MYGISTTFKKSFKKTTFVYKYDNCIRMNIYFLKEIHQITLSYGVSYAAKNDLIWRMLVHTTDIEMAGHLCVFCYVSSVHHFVWISSRNPLLCKCMAFLPYVSFGVLSYGLIWCMSWHNHLVDIDELFVYALMFFFFVIWQLYLL